MESLHDTTQITNAPITSAPKTSATVAYVIECSISTGAYTDKPNIMIEYGSAEKSSLHKLFIERIVIDMYEFCSAEFGHGINISSYDDYCVHYTNINGIFRNTSLYMMHYFVDGIWKTWNPVMYDNEVYMAYFQKINAK